MLLHGSHVSSKGRLVTNSRWDTTKQSRHFAAGMGEPEDVVDEEKHVLVLTLLVAEILGNGQTGKSNTSTSARGSFICPYTRATLEDLSLREMTPPSIISWYKSLPSLVISPTPANTEKPP